MESVLNGIMEYSEREIRTSSTKHERRHVGVALGQAGGDYRLACSSGGARPRDAAGPRRAAGPEYRTSGAPKQGPTPGGT